MDQWAKLPIEVLGLSNRSYNCLKRAEIDTIGKLVELSKEDLLMVRNLGKLSADEIMEAVQSFTRNQLWTMPELSAETYDNIPKNSMDYMIYKDIAKAGKKKMLHYIDETTILKKVHDIAFYDMSGMLVEDIIVEELMLSKRSSGALIRNGYLTAKQVIYANYEDIAHLNSLGATSLAEIIDKLKEVTYILFDTGVDNQLVEEYARVICEDIQQFCPKIKTSYYISQILLLVYENQELLNENIKDLLENTLIMNQIYSDKKIYKLFKNYICSILFDSFEMPLYSLKQKMPEGLRNSDLFMKMIQELTREGRIDYTEGGIQYHYVTVNDYMNSMEEGPNKTAMLCRLQGMTLEETGQVLGITRERVRQLVNKVTSRMPKLR